MKKIVSFLIILISLISLCGCDENIDNGKLKVVTTIFPIYDMVRYIGEDLVDISMMVSPGQDIHSYDPSASDIIDVKKCDLLVYIGDAMESWIKDIVDTNNQLVIPLSKDERIDLESLDHHEDDVDHEDHNHHHDHDHGVKKWIQSIDGQSSGLWSFMLGIFFAIAFCPHRFIYFFTMIDISLSLPTTWNWLLPFVFGLATGLPIMIIAWLISYSAISVDKLTARMHGIQKWIRYVSAILFIGFGIYLCVHIFSHGIGCSCSHEEHIEHVCCEEHCHH